LIWSFDFFGRRYIHKKIDKMGKEIEQKERELTKKEKQPATAINITNNYYGPDSLSQPTSGSVIEE
jgi:hypothetical protein